MSSTVTECVLIEARADNLAFRVGQLVEQLLTDRAMELAGRSGSSLVTVEHIESCLDDVLSDPQLRRVTESSHGGTAGEEGVGAGEPRKAA